MLCDQRSLLFAVTLVPLPRDGPLARAEIRLLKPIIVHEVRARRLRAARPPRRSRGSPARSLLRCCVAAGASDFAIVRECGRGRG
jgi:hypothetical protein